MNKENLIANWDSLTDETKTKILALADTEIKEEYFVPKEEEVYYFSSMSFIVNEITALSETYDNTVFDNFNLAIDNCFRTPEEAIFAGWCDYYTKRFETYANRHSKKLDWDNEKQPKFYVYKVSGTDYLTFNTTYEFKYQGTTYASSEQILKDAIADIGKEKFLKYVLKVEK